MKLRNVLFSLAVGSLLTGSAAWAAEPQPPVRLTGGVEENRFIPGNSKTPPASAPSRKLSTKEVNNFLNNPRVYRVTQVDPPDKQSGRQNIRALHIYSVKINQNGKVELGDLIEGSGQNWQVPPGTCKVGDLVTFEDQQVIEVPKSHFDPLGGLAETGKQQLPLTPTEAAMNAARKMDKVADAVQQNVKTAAEHFGAGVGKWVQSQVDTAKFLFGQPPQVTAQKIADTAGKIAQYVSQHPGETAQKIWQAPGAAFNEFKKDPWGFAGEQAPNFIPWGKFGQFGKFASEAGNLAKVEGGAEALGGLKQAAAVAEEANGTVQPATAVVKNASDAANKTASAAESATNSVKKAAGTLENTAGSEAGEVIKAAPAQQAVGAGGRASRTLAHGGDGGKNLPVKTGPDRTVPKAPEESAPSAPQTPAPSETPTPPTTPEPTQVTNNPPSPSTPDRIPGASDPEHAIDEALKAEGRDVKPNPLEGQQGAGRQGDRLVDGKLTEYKTVSGVKKLDPDSLSGAIANRIMNGRGQAKDIIVDARKQPGMTKEIAERGAKRAYGADNKTGGKIESIRIIGKDFDVTLPRG